MRIITLIISLIILPLSMMGQSTQEIISRYSEQLAGYQTLYATYNFAIEGKEGNTKFAIDGEFYSQGDKFLVKTYFSDIYCNGEYKAVHDKSVDEVTLIGHNIYDTNMSENPFSVLKNGPYAYSFPEESEKVTLDGMECFQVTLTPKDEKADHLSVDVVVSTSDYAIRKICYTTRSGDKFIAKVKSISEGGAKEGTFFEFDEEANPDVEINDLR